MIGYHVKYSFVPVLAGGAVCPIMNGDHAIIDLLHYWNYILDECNDSGWVMTHLIRDDDKTFGPKFIGICFEVYDHGMQGDTSLVPISALYFSHWFTIVILSEIHLYYDMVWWEMFLEMTHLGILCFYACHMILELVVPGAAKILLCWECFPLLWSQTSFFPFPRFVHVSTDAQQPDQIISPSLTRTSGFNGTSIPSFFSGFSQGILLRMYGVNLIDNL